MPVVIVLSIASALYIGFMQYFTVPSLCLGAGGACTRSPAAIAGAALLVLLLHVLVALALVSYMRAVFTDPGSVPEEWIEAAAGAVLAGSVPMDNVINSEGGVTVRTLPVHAQPLRYCFRCDHPKPRRCHHCSVCERCVLKMDHHCPWIANCVGHYNHKYFLLFLLYSALSCAIVAASLVPTLGPQLFSPRSTARPSALAAATLVMALAFAITLSLFTCFSAFLLVHGVTTIEAHSSTEATGGWRKHVESVMGASMRTWLLPVQPHDIGSGTQWGACDETDSEPCDEEGQRLTQQDAHAHAV